MALIHIEAVVVNRLRAMRESGEEYGAGPAGSTGGERELRLRAGSASGRARRESFAIRVAVSSRRAFRKARHDERDASPMCRRPPGMGCPVGQDHVTLARASA
jgi:hypothetical protein